MEEKKTEFIAWVKEYKKQLLLTGISVTVIIGVIIGLKNKEAIIDLWDSLEKSIEKVPKELPESLNVATVMPLALEEEIPVRFYTSPREAFDVRQHIRNLSGGRHHSAEKAIEAAALGVSLLPNQTLVDTYTKCAA